MARYAEIEDLYRFAASRETFEGLAAEEVLVPALDAASLLVDNYVGAATNGYGTALYEVPLIDWGADIRRAAAVIAAWEIVRVHRIRPGEPVDENPLYLAYKDVLSWLKGLGTGAITIVGVDPIPTEVGGAGMGTPMASSNAQRGYHETSGFLGNTLPFQGGRSRW